MLRFMLVTAMVYTAVMGADLIISGQSDKTYDSGTWDRLIISNSSNITVRGLNFKTPAGTDVPATISGSDSITVENCDIDGNTDACSGLEIGGSSYITIKGCTIHNIADDGVEMSGHHIYFIDNTIHDLKGCGTDGGCGPCYNGHSDGFELSNLHDSEFRGNLVYNVNSTAAFFMGDWGAPNCSNLILENNIFYTPRCGFAIYVHYVDGIRLYNNIFWKGIYGGLAIGAEVTGMDCYNNIVQNINFNHAGITPDPSEHRMDYNFLGIMNEGYDKQAHDVLFPNPRFKKIPHAISTTVYTEVTREDFEIQTGSMAIGAGVDDGQAPATDIYGNDRGAVMDMGPFAVGGTPVADMTDTAGKARFGCSVRNRNLVLTGLPSGTRSVCVYDSIGNRVLQRECAAGAARMDISALGDGIIFVQVTGPGIDLVDILVITAGVSGN